MAKYSEAQLQQMARTALLAKTKRPAMYAELVMVLCARTRMLPIHVEQNIVRLAQ